MTDATRAAVPVSLRCEYQADPLGVDVERPRLSWHVCDPRRGARQTAWQVVAASTAERLDADEGDLWDSGKVAGDASIHVPYAGKALASRARCFWKVRTWDADDEPSPWSAASSWEVGLLDREDWTGRWIGSSIVGGAYSTCPCPYVRKAFALDRPVAAARLYVTALGLYECLINGQRVGTDVFTPGWTDYRKRVQYRVYDVANLLAEGANAIGAILGDGWYCGHVGGMSRQRYGDRPRLLAQLEVLFADGDRVTVATDETWRTATGPLLESDLIMGESLDARLKMPGWASAGFDDSRWSEVVMFEDRGIPVVATPCPPVRAIQELHPVGPPARPRGNRGPWVFDLGQNMVGRVRLKVRGEAGTTVTLRHAEMLNPDGTLYTENLRSARATDRYTLRGDGIEVYEPRFTFHGFRYVEVSGLGGELGADAVTGVVLHSDMPPTGDFECSDAQVNQLQSNITWGQKGNFLEVPTDCPQRDERLGWTGDAQVFVHTATVNFDVAAFFTKWRQDLEDAQSEAGAYPPVVPNTGLGGDGGPAWADAGIICPWTIYLCYGDRRILEEHYDSMARFIAYLEATSRDGIRTYEGYEGFHGFGDWLAIDAPTPGEAPTPRSLIGTAYFAYSTALLARIARVLGREDDAARYESLRETVREAFNREFVTPAARIVGNSQTGYLLALGFDLLPEEKREAALGHLVRDIERRGGHLSTGFVGTPLLTPVLTRLGRTDVAYRLLMQETYPSWLYTVKQGATTMWERWNSWTKEHGFGDAGMNSFNHYAYGSVGQWLYGTVGGIAADADGPGYRRIVVRPQPGGGLTWARARLVSPYGAIETRWSVEGDAFRLEVTIPPNTSARVFVPVAEGGAVTEGGVAAGEADGVCLVGREGEAAVFDVGAGSYVFAAPRVRQGE